MKNTLLALSTTIAAMALIAGCDKATASTSDGSMPTYRTISSQFHSACPSLEAVDANSQGTESTPQRTPWPASTESVDAGIYDWNGFLLTQGHFSVPAGLGPDQPHLMMWNARYPDGRRVPSGVYFQFLTLRDSTGTVVGHDSLCMGVSNHTID